MLSTEKFHIGFAAGAILQSAESLQREKIKERYNELCLSSDYTF